MKKWILMLAFMSLIGNGTVLVATACPMAKKSQQSCCATKMATCKNQCSMSHTKVKTTEGAVFSQAPKVSSGYDMIGILAVETGDAYQKAFLVNPYSSHLLSFLHSVPIYIKNHQFLI